jgi:hypothetical protein
MRSEMRTHAATVQPHSTVHCGDPEASDRGRRPGAGVPIAHRGRFPASKRVVFMIRFHMVRNGVRLVCASPDARVRAA